MNVLFYIEGLNLGGQQTFWLNIFKRCNGNNITLYVGVVKESTALLKDYQAIAKKIVRIGDQSTTLRFNLQSIPKITKQAIALRKIVKENQIDIVACNGPFTFAASVFASFLCEFSLIRFVGGDLRKHEKSLFSFTALNFIYRRPKKYFGYQFMYQELLKKGVKNNQIAFNFSGNAVDEKLFKPATIDKKRNARRASGISDNEIVLGWVGRISPDMEVFETIKLFIEISSKIPAAKLIVVGDGSSKPYIVDWISNQGLSNRVIFTGFVPYEEVHQWYQKMDVVALLDVDPHGGSIIREAMSCGVVPLTVDGNSRSQRDIIEHGVSGILISPENRIQSAAEWLINLNSDRDRLEKLKVGARSKVLESLSFSSLAKAFELELQSVKSEQVVSTG
jgi:glycosyltransferase involved in cell wall biosynthesis